MHSFVRSELEGNYWPTACGDDGNRTIDDHFGRGYYVGAIIPALSLSNFAMFLRYHGHLCRVIRGRAVGCPPRMRDSILRSSLRSRPVGDAY
jgi:hypothetical protein